jgi:cell division protein FtsB
MSFLDDPRKAKVAFIVTLCLLILFFLTSGVLGYFYYQKYNENKKLAGDYNSIKSQLEGTNKNESKQVSDLKKQIEDLTKTNSSLTSENNTLKSQNADYKAKQAKVSAYNEFFIYMNQVIEIHNGFTGWTDAEFQVGKQKAEATGDASFVSDVNWAWYETSVPVEQRLLKVLKDIAAGIKKGY